MDTRGKLRMLANREAIPGLELEVSNRDLRERDSPQKRFPTTISFKAKDPFARLEKEMQ